MRAVESVGGAVVTAFAAGAISACSLVSVRSTPDENNCDDAAAIASDAVATALAGAVVVWAMSTASSDCSSPLCNNKQEWTGGTGLLLLAVAGPSLIYGIVAHSRCETERKRRQGITLDTLAAATSCDDIKAMATVLYERETRVFEQRFADDMRIARCVPVLTEKRLANLREWSAAYAAEGDCESARQLRERAFALQKALDRAPDLPDSDLGSCVLH